MTPTRSAFSRAALLPGALVSSTLVSGTLFFSALLASAAVSSAGAAWVDLPALSSAPVRSFSAPLTVVDPAKNYRAVLHTGRGDVTLALYAKAAPKAVNSFVFLSLNHYYDGTPFHRVVAGFVAQGGDPTGTGTGGPGYTFATEPSPLLNFDMAGVLGTARTQDPGSNGSQFFITLAPAAFLDGQYTVFGQVLSGQAAVDALNKTAPGVTPDTLQGVTIQVDDGK